MKKIRITKSLVIESIAKQINDYLESKNFDNNTKYEKISALNYLATTLNIYEEVHRKLMELK